MKELNIFIERYGKIGFLRLLAYPVTLLLSTPFVLLVSLWNSRVLFKRGKHFYVHFNIESAINCLFYLTRAQNLFRFGRNGRSPYLGLGNYNMGRMFHYSKPSFFLFWKYPAHTIFFGMIIWLLTHLIWLKADQGSYWVILSIGITAISSSFYANTFRYQNYNVVGWAFFPLFLYFVTTQNWWISGAIMLLIALGSFTLVVLNCFLLLTAAIYHASFYPILVGIPGVLLIASHFLPLLRKENEGKSTLESVMKAIGMKSGREVRYKRKYKGKRFRLTDIYFLLLNLQFFAVIVWQTNSLPVYFLTGIVLFVINIRFFRFADEQSFLMFLLSLSVPLLIANPMNFFVLISYWLLVAPLPSLAGYDSNVKVLDVLPIAQPIDMMPLIADMSQVMAGIPKDSRVFMAFEDPGDVYENVYSGYRRFIELPSYVASNQQFLLLPEWWGVFELNYPGAPEIWGRSPEAVLTNATYWDADYVMIYQEKETTLAPEWENQNFELMGSFDWRDYASYFKNHKKFDPLQLKFFILKRP